MVRLRAVGTWEVASADCGFRWASKAFSSLGQGARGYPVDPTSAGPEPLTSTRPYTLTNPDLPRAEPGRKLLQN